MREGLSGESLMTHTLHRSQKEKGKLIMKLRKLQNK